MLTTNPPPSTAATSLPTADAGSTAAPIQRSVGRAPATSISKISTDSRQP